MHDDVGTGWMIVMMVLTPLVWAAVILGIAWLARGGGGGWREPRKETPTEILNRRFAEGAISAEDYQERLKVLKG
jgi:putative membrane protein